MKKCVSLSALLLLSTFALYAQDSRGHRSPHRLTPATNTHSGESPFDPGDEDDTLFIVDSSPSLDTGCTFRSGGPLMISLMVKRYVGDVGSDGLLLNPGALISRGLLSPTATVRLPAWDIDVFGGDDVPPEVDNISFNGHLLGSLTGDNDIWKLNSFEIPIQWVKFPAKGTPGSAPAPAENIVQIDIDTASGTDENWCMAVDWVQAEFKAVAPVFLVHGTNAQSTSWDPNFTAFFRSTGMPWSNDINLAANGPIIGNGVLLMRRLNELALSFGAKKCHIIAHSKGGLDTRAYLNNNYSPDQLKVLSVYTLSTPHHGTIVSDIIVAARAAVNPESTNADIQYLISHDSSWFSTPQPPAINEQTTVSMGAFNSRYPSVPSDVLFYNYGANADLNGNGTIQSNETVDLLPNLGFITAAAGNAMYRAIGNTASIIVTRATRPGRIYGTNTYTAIEMATPTMTFQVNDLVTSVTSAHSPDGIFLGQLAANHSSMKSQALAAAILSHIASDFPAH